MGFSLSFDATPKVGRGDVRGLLHHVVRDVDREHGSEVRHSNQDIDPSRTADNETLVSDGQGGWVPCEDIEQIESVLESRLAEVKKPLRKDAVVLRPVVLQLDPEWYEQHPDPEERGQAAEDMLRWAAGVFGPENLVYASLHEDESNPHLHVGVCPVTEDGRLSQKDWFKSPAALRAMHQDFRQHMADLGYDIEFKNKKPGKHAKRLGVEEYKDYKELEKVRQELDAEKRALEARERACTRKEGEIRAQAEKARQMASEAQETLSKCKALKQAERQAMEERIRRIAEDAERMLQGGPEREF